MTLIFEVCHSISIASKINLMEQQLNIFNFINRKELIRSLPTLLIIGAVIYLTRKLTSGTRGQGVSYMM